MLKRGKDILHSSDQTDINNASDFYLSLSGFWEDNVNGSPKQVHFCHVLICFLKIMSWVKVR